MPCAAASPPRSTLGWGHLCRASATRLGPNSIHEGRLSWFPNGYGGPVMAPLDQCEPRPHVSDAPMAVIAWHGSEDSRLAAQLPSNYELRHRVSIDISDLEQER